VFNKIIFSLLITAGFAAHAMDNQDKNLFDSFNQDHHKAKKRIKDQKLGEQVFDTVLIHNTRPSTKDDSAPQLQLGQSNLFIIHKSKL
jgi:hypothetical protein